MAFRRILVPLLGDGATRAVPLACRLAAERGAAVIAVAVVEVPQELPLDALMPGEEERARDELREARTLAELYGVTIETRLVRGRDAAEAVVEEARASRAELLLLSASRTNGGGRRAPILGSRAAALLKRAPCRVLIASPSTDR